MMTYYPKTPAWFLLSESRNEVPYEIFGVPYELCGILDDNNALRGNRWEPKRIREMHILSDKYPFFLNGNGVYFLIRLSRKALLENSFSVVARIRKEGNQADIHALVKLEFHLGDQMLKTYIGRELVPLRKPGLLGKHFSVNPETM